MLEVTIRPEEPHDYDAIYNLTRAAFEGRSYAAGDEQDLIGQLRERGVLRLSLVAQLQDEVIGQITFSPATPGDKSEHWYALGPVAVLPKFQSQGVGGKLIKAGLSVIESRGAHGCILTGNPDYYTRFGFALSPEHAPVAEPAEFFMIRPSGHAIPPGAFTFHEAFYDQD